ncbi:phosphotransferase [Pluralibacter gergoviae]|uniref:phosphotransferase enzyme family protein n=1 Tax=Pluralibacter gergoviae TaxID=61647 RepID=UPI0029103133|nr:phosphotransferase [Pluralibacter gergoviae]MDU4005653.1 phosphotransferase [Pluralibacter gergoviae]
MGAKQYDTLSNDTVILLAERALVRYPAFAGASVKLLCRSENATLLVTRAGRRYALRIHRGDYHSRRDIESELLWLDALREAGICVPEALYDRDDERVQILTLADGSVRHAVLFHWIEGEMPTTEVDPAAFRQLGKITAGLHRQSRQWRRPEGFRRIVWDHQSMVAPDGHWGDWRDAGGLSGGDCAVVEEAIASIRRQMAAFGQSPQRYGLIHADLRLTNLLLHKGETRVIDFDDCGMGWYLHDLAAAVSFAEHHPNAPQWVENWLAGYEQVAHIGDEELAIVPAMLAQRRIQLTAWVASHRETEMAQSLGDGWTGHTVRLCRRYLDGAALPLGV